METEEEFDDVFGSEPNVAYHEQALHAIQKHRRLLENELFFDRLLKAVGIDQASKLYPPHSNHDLRILFNRITSSASPDHQKQSLVYYLLRDLPSEASGAEAFAERSYLPDKYQTFIDGIWYLDRLKLERALDYLASPTLIPTFPDEILYTLCRHAPQNDSSLPLSYYHSVYPPLASAKVLCAFFERSCKASLTEAFYFSRCRGPLQHRPLFVELITFVHANSAGSARASRALELINLPFSDEEERWFEEFLNRGLGTTLYGAKDTLMMRKLAKGQVKEAVDLGSKLSGRKIDGLNWDILREGLRKGGTIQ
ncbi:hypothetical protein MMC26_002120 [Xylographa opegraphella]|nr:hypothetical protein [Xylographa opegraphella]